MNTRPVTVTVTGAAGQIAYALLFRIASGQLLGTDTPVRLQLLEIPQAVRPPKAPPWNSTTAPSPYCAASRSPTTPTEAFDGANIALLVGARPAARAWNAPICLKPTAASSARKGRPQRPRRRRRPGARRRQSRQHQRADRPRPRPRHPRRPLHRHDAPGPQPRRLPDRPPPRRARRRGPQGHHLGQPLLHPVPRPVPRRGQRQKATTLVDETWIHEVFIPTVAGRGAAIIDARGASSAASAANAAIDHVHDWINGTPADTWTSAAVVSDGSYGVPEGLVSGFPVVSRNGRYEIVHGLQIDQRAETASTTR